MDLESRKLKFRIRIRGLYTLRVKHPCHGRAGSVTKAGGALGTWGGIGLKLTEND